MAELLGPKAIEDAAIEWVMGLERAAGRRPRDTRHQQAKEQRYYTVPWPVADYDSCPGQEALT